MDQSVEFGRFRVFIGRRELWADGRPAPIGARALDLLIALAGRPGELVTKDELLALVWGGAAVADGAITARIAAVRRALGDGERRPLCADRAWPRLSLRGRSGARAASGRCDVGARAVGILAKAEGKAVGLGRRGLG